MQPHLWGVWGRAATGWQVDVDMAVTKVAVGGSTSRGHRRPTGQWVSGIRGCHCVSNGIGKLVSHMMLHPPAARTM
jgi:hypothetical protein